MKRRIPGVKVELISGPYSTTKEQVVAGAAAGTMSDVVGLDGAWVSDFVKQGSLASMTDLMGEAGYDDSGLAAQIQLDGATYMIPVVNFVYPVFVNLDLLEAAGIESANLALRVCRGSRHADGRSQQRLRLGPAPVSGTAERHPERCDVMGVGFWRQHDERRQAGPGQ